MSVSLSDLTPLQIRLMIRLDEDCESHDHVGRLRSEIPPFFAPAIASLCDLEIAEETAGWNGTSWIRLTGLGRRLRAMARSE
ncbi:hypothetical protein [Aureimonas psammosilenae]|uniref:hypothetical protein n=1 Tax=Aureimonas psammosilenae TaxID=2495496 RepID=UPI001260E59D|nr:hypothetical protein [Aureimonas psammosilenae]